MMYIMFVLITLLVLKPLNRRAYMKIKIGSGDYELWLANLRENQSVLKSLKAEKSANNTDTLDYEDTYLFGSIDEIEGWLH